MDGIEVYHRDHNAEVSKRYELLCDEIERDLGVTLYRTGGSDFHHEEYGRVREPLGVTRLNNEYALEIVNRNK